jgi:hypothetical protein
VTDVHRALPQAELLDQLFAPEPAPPARRRWPYVLVAAALIAAGAGAVVVLRGDDGPQGPPHPSTWDPRVQTYVDFVQDTRDLQFKHPVYVDFLPEEESPTP